jgi:predicted amidohydrolase YtcJ
VILLPLKVVVQLTMRGTARRFHAIGATAVRELLAKVRLAFNRSTHVLHFRHVSASNHPQVTPSPPRKI